MPRRREPRISDPAEYPKRYVSLTVAAEWLECDRRTLNGLLDEGRIQYITVGRRRKILLSALMAFERCQLIRNGEAYE